MNIPRFSYPYGAMKFMAVLAIRILIANNCARWRRIFKGLSKNGGWADFSKNLRVSLFYKYLSNEPTFRRFHLAGQYLKGTVA
jgi:hypothetical protein